MRMYQWPLRNNQWGSFEENLNHLDDYLETPEMAGIKINATKSCFAAHKLEFLSYLISQDGIHPLASKVEAIKNGQTSTYMCPV